MWIIDDIIKFFTPKKRIKIELDSESVREHNVIKGLANENAELKGEIGKLTAKFGKLRESEKDKEEDEDVRWELNKQKKELERKVYPKYLSLKSFYYKLLRDKKFKKNIGFYSFDRGKKLASFGDIGFSSDGDVVLLDDKGEVLMKMRSLNDIFQSVAGLGNDIATYKIPLNVDRTGGYVENIMVWESPELTPSIDGKFQLTKARKRHLWEYLNELRDKIGGQHQYIEELELTNTELKKDNDGLKVKSRVAEDSSETLREELSENEQSVKGVHRLFRKTERDLSQVRDINIIIEDNLEKLENQVTKLRDEAEREGIKLSDDRAMELIQRIRRELVRDEPTPPTKIIEKIVEKPQNIPQT